MLPMMFVLLVLIAIPFTGYPMLLWLRSRIAPQAILRDQVTPSVDLVICAHNEADAIEAKLHNALALNYPQAALTIWVASDGSTDDTVTRASAFVSERVHVLDLPRGGKAAALNHIVSLGEAEVLAFSDANSMWQDDALLALVSPLADQDIGGVAGDQQYENASAQNSGERGYWSFDRLLKSWQSRAGNVISATGAIYCVRRELFEPAPADATDDFMISTAVIAAGRRLVFAQDAVAIEPAATASNIEFRRKVRVISRGLRSVFYRRALLNPTRYGLYALELLIHKLWRRLVWIPLLMLVVISPFALTGDVLSRSIGLTVLSVTCIAVLGLLVSGLRRFRMFSVAGFVIMVNVACAVAAYNFMTGQRMTQWNLPRDSEATSGPEVKP
ncbi:MAG: glycosyltransferase family 2 protein [Pseudomonadaceae bacterium]|nr:glycosyltransferase family 2 protein [Pseudomonadaceae bacterium]